MTATPLPSHQTYILVGVAGLVVDPVVELGHPERAQRKPNGGQQQQQTVKQKHRGDLTKTH